MSRLLATAALALGLACAPAYAQVEAPATQQTTQDFSDSDLKSFAAALVEVSRINDTYLPIYHAAKTPEEQQLVERKASEEMMQAVRNQGISVDKYQDILMTARSNPEVANRIHELVKDAAAK